MFVRKRDPRYKAHLARQSQTNTAAASASTSAIRTPTSRTPARPSTPSTIPQFVEQEWQKASGHAQDFADLEWGAVEGGEDPEEWECVACGKSFRSEAAWDSHERSKKHLKAVEMLRREMEREQKELGLDVEGEVNEIEDADEQEEDGQDGEEIEVLDGQPEQPPTRSPTPEKNEERSEHADGPPSLSEVEAPSPPQGNSRKKGSKPSSRPASPPRASRTERKVQDDVPEPLRSPANDDVSKTTATVPKPELSKREKRRAREAEKKARQEDSSPKLVCL